MSESKAASWLYSQNQFKESEEIKIIAKTIAITSGKGGVGKTSIALKFSKVLSDSAKKVLLIDCDFNLSNTGVKLGLPVNDNFASLVNGHISFDECIHRDGNLHILSSCNGNVELFDQSKKLSSVIISFIMEKESEYDFIILDCPAGIDKDIMSLNSYCDHRIVVVTPDKSSITDSYSLIKVLNKKYGIKENHLFVNMVRDIKDYKRVVKVMSETIDDFLGVRVQVLGAIPHENISPCAFDKLVIGEEKSSFHKIFSKLVSRFTEVNGTSVFVKSVDKNDGLNKYDKRHDVATTIC